METHPVADIMAANNARKRLKRDFKLSVRPYKIVDERAPKRPAVGAFAYFTKAKRAEVPGGTISAVSKQLSQEWKNLSEAEKRPYGDLAAAEFAKFNKEVERLKI